MGALKNFLEYMDAAPGGGKTEKVQDLKDSMRRQPIDRKRRPIEGGILKLLVRRNQQISETQFKIGKIRQSVQDIARRREEEKRFTKKNYARVKMK